MAGLCSAFDVCQSDIFFHVKHKAFTLSFCPDLGCEGEWVVLVELTYPDVLPLLT